MKTKRQAGRPPKGKDERIIRIVVKLSRAEARPILAAAAAKSARLAVWAREALKEAAKEAAKAVSHIGT